MCFNIEEKNNKMKYKTRNELLLDNIKKDLVYMERLSKTNPNLAKKEATDALIEMGLIDENCNLKPPYNGEKVNLDDFERGPKKALRK